jgi:poly(A) polymerase
MDELEERLAELRQREELDALRPEIDGVEVMDALGLPPGRDVGAALDFLMKIRLEQGLIGKDEALRRVREWWTARRSGGT